MNHTTNKTAIDALMAARDALTDCMLSTPNDYTLQLALINAALAPTVQGSVDTPEFYQLLQNWYLCHPNTKSVPLYRKIVAHIDAALAQRAAVAAVTSEHTEKLLWALRTVRAIADLGRYEPLGEWYTQAVMVCGTLKRVLGDTPEAIEAGTSDAPTASTPPAPAEKYQYTKEWFDKMAQLEQEADCNIGAAASPLMQVAPSGLPEAVRTWHEAERIRIEAVNTYNAKLEAGRKFGFPGPDVNAEYQAMTNTGNAAHRLLRPMFDALTVHFAAAPVPPAVAPEQSVRDATSGGGAVAFGYVTASAAEHLSDYTEEGMPNSIRVYNAIDEERGKMIPVYLAPQSLPAASDASVRNRALEEAAALCVEAANSCVGPRSLMAAGCAMDIRALISKEEGK